MRAGRLRELITIQQKTEIQDEQTGAITITWKKFTRVRASIDYLSAKEFIQSKSNQGQVSCRITIRYMEGVLPEMRILADGKVFNIHGVLPDNKSGKKYLTMPCSIGVNNGE